MTRTMIDSAYPLHPEPHKDVTLVYIGGDTPHSWSAAEILALPSRWVLPTWVRSNPGQVNAVADAAACADRLVQLGVPFGTCCCLDLETAVDATYVRTFDSALSVPGWLTTKYGSGNRDGTGFIWQNPQTSGGTFLASPNGDSAIPVIGDCVAVQYAFDGSFDLSTVATQHRFPLWEINPPTPPPPPSSWQEAMMRQLPTLKLNSPNHNDVQRAQALLQAARLSVGKTGMDGIFGPATQAAVAALQSRYHHADPTFAVDGVIGPQTWTALVTGSAT